jgi:hypothetical protein
MTKHYENETWKDNCQVWLLVRNLCHISILPWNRKRQVPDDMHNSRYSHHPDALHLLLEETRQLIRRGDSCSKRMDVGIVASTTILE